MLKLLGKKKKQAVAYTMQVIEDFVNRIPLTQELRSSIDKWDLKLFNTAKETVM